MNEIKCPKCGEEFSIDESYYNLIVKQIRDKEFVKEVKNLEAKYEKDMEHQLQLSKMELQKDFDEELADKDAEIVKLKIKISIKYHLKVIALFTNLALFHFRKTCNIIIFKII